jgi:hypothetical protein
VARAAVLVGIVLAGFFAPAAASYQWRYDVAHDLYQIGEVTEARDAEVYYSCGRGCSYEMRAVVDFSDGPRNVNLPEVTFDHRGLPQSQWVPAPEPYSGTFNVYYDPELPQDTRRILSQDDVESAFRQDPSTLWIVVGIFVIWSLAWMRPASRPVGGSIRVLSLAPTAPGAESRRPDSWRLDVVAAVGLATAGLGILLFSGSAWNAVVAMHLDQSGTATEGFDATVRVVAGPDGQPASDKVFAEIVIEHDRVANKIVPVELVTPVQERDSALTPDWYESIAPYTDGFAVKYDPANPDLAIAVADIEQAARPGALVIPLTVIVLGTTLAGWAWVWPAVRRQRAQQPARPGMISGGQP